MATPELLHRLLVAAGPSGRETAPAKVWRDGCAAFSDDVRVDAVGSSMARVPGTADGPTLAVIGHIDEIGVHVTHIDDDGHLRFGEVGGWDPIVLVGQRVTIAAARRRRGRRDRPQADPPASRPTSATVRPRSRTSTSTSAPRTATRPGRWCGSATSA